MNYVVMAETETTKALPGMALTFDTVYLFDPPLEVDVEDEEMHELVSELVTENLVRGMLQETYPLEE